MRSSEREQFLADIITTAIEGGTGYWAVVHAYKWDGLPPAQVYATITPTDVRRAPGMDYHGWLSEHGCVINIDLIERGLDRIARCEVGVRRDLKAAILMGNTENDGGWIDADGADVIVQAGLFGELVYG